MPPAIKDNNRISDRLHNCVFCGEISSKIGRHLETHRKEEKILVLQKFNAKSQKKQRTFIIDRLRFLGDFYHNLKVSEVGGKLIIYRRPQAGILVSYKNYMPCKYCLPCYNKDELWRHTQKMYLS